MRILAIDPGLEQSAVVEYTPGELLEIHGILPNDEVVRFLAKEALARTSRDELVIEMVASYGMPVGRDIFETVLWTGRFVQAWAFWDLPWSLLYRREVKLHLCGTARAKDGNVRQALIDLLGPTGTKAAPGPTFGFKKDLWAALGVAVTHAAARADVRGGPAATPQTPADASADPRRAPSADAGA